MKSAKVIYALAIVLLTLVMSGADLTFDLKIGRGAAEDYNPENKKKNIAVFVIDCSGSMKGLYSPSGKKEDKYYGPVGRRSQKPWTRLQKLCDELLPVQFKALPKGTHVYAYLYSLLDGWTPYRLMEKVLDSEETKKQFLHELQTAVRKRTMATDNEGYGGATPYFDTLALALDTIREENWLDDQNVNLRLFNYTDGKNNAWPYSYFDGKKRRKLRFLSKENDEKSTTAAQDQFNRFYGKDMARIQNEKPRLSYFRMNVGTTADRPGFNRTPEYKVDFYREQSVLKNPKDAPNQTIPLSADFGVDLESWKLLQNQRVSLKVQFNDGPVKPYPIVISTSQQIKGVEVPVGATRVTVFLDCSKIKTHGKFKLNPAVTSEKIKFPAADPSKAGIEAVKVQNRLYVKNTVLTIRKGKKVSFTAEGSAQKYIWRFFEGHTPIFTQKSKDGESISYQFKKTGDYSFEVAAEGAGANEPNRRKTGRIEVVDIGIQILEQKGNTRPGQTVSFEILREKIVKNRLLPPSSLEWYVDGPFTGKDKEVPLSTQLSGNSYQFRSAGTYTVRVVAKYDKLPLDSIEAETPWVVSEPAEIKFTKDTPAEGQRLDCGKGIKMRIDTTEGKINLKSIVWKADGKVIGRETEDIVYQHPFVQAPVKVVITVEAKDAVLNEQRTRNRTYTFCCSCSDNPPVLKIRDRKTNKPTWDVGADVDFEVLSAEKFDKITFTFDGDPTPVQAVNGHVTRKADKGGEFKYKMTCFCKKCKKKFEEEKTLKTHADTPKPVLKVEEKRTRFSNGEIITLKDNGNEDGAYAYCRLEMEKKKKNSPEEFEWVTLAVFPKGKGKPYTLGKDEGFEVPPHWPWADYKLRLVPLDGNQKDISEYQGKKVGPSEELKISVRPPWWVSLCILVGELLVLWAVLYVFSLFLWGQGPRAWKLHYKTFSKAFDKPTPDNCHPDKVRGADTVYLNPPYWKRLPPRMAVVPLEQLVGESYAQHDGELIINPADADDPFSTKYAENFRRPKTGLKALDTNEPNMIYEVRSLSAPEDWKKVNDEDIKYLALLLDKSGRYWGGTIWFIILLIPAVAAWGLTVWWLCF